MEYFAKKISECVFTSFEIQSNASGKSAQVYYNGKLLTFSQYNFNFLIRSGGYEGDDMQIGFQYFERLKKEDLHLDSLSSARRIVLAFVRNIDILKTQLPLHTVTHNLPTLPSSDMDIHDRPSEDEMQLDEMQLTHSSHSSQSIAQLPERNYYESMAERLKTLLKTHSLMEETCMLPSFDDLRSTVLQIYHFQKFRNLGIPEDVKCVSEMSEIVQVMKTSLRESLDIYFFDLVKRIHDPKEDMELREFILQNSPLSKLDDENCNEEDLQIMLCWIQTHHDEFLSEFKEQRRFKFVKVQRNIDEFVSRSYEEIERQREDWLQLVSQSNELIQGR